MTGAATRARAAEEADVVVLLDDGGRAVGTAPRATVHHAETPLHLAFSCYLFRGSQLLLTRRALSKRTFPGVWTNSVCGHPQPGEPLVDAVRRRARDELGLDVGGLRLVLPSFRYRAQMHGVVEHELCPVLVGTVTADPAPDPAEVGEVAFEPWPSFVDDVVAGRRAVSPWCARQLVELVGLGPDPGRWASGPESLLPPAVTLR